MRSMLKMDSQLETCQELPTNEILRTLNIQAKALRILLSKIEKLESRIATLEGEEFEIN